MRQSPSHLFAHKVWYEYNISEWKYRTQELISLGGDLLFVANL